MLKDTPSGWISDYFRFLFSWSSHGFYILVLIAYIRWQGQRTDWQWPLNFSSGHFSSSFHLSEKTLPWTLIQTPSDSFLVRKRSSNANALVITSILLKDNSGAHFLQTFFRASFPQFNFPTFQHSNTCPKMKSSISFSRWRNIGTFSKEYHGNSDENSIRICYRLIFLSIWRQIDGELFDGLLLNCGKCQWYDSKLLNIKLV